MARDGKITRYLDIKTLTELLKVLLEGNTPRNPVPVAFEPEQDKGGSAQ